MNMTRLASDTAVTAIAQVVKDSQHVGFIMKREQSIPNEKLSKKEAMIMMKKVVEDLHAKKIIHGDIKLSNMVLCADGRIRLCDFGGAFYEHHAAQVCPLYTIQFLSPYRVLHEKEPFTMEDDLFALGVTIWHLFTEKEPFEGLHGTGAKKALKEGKIVEVLDIEDEEARTVTKKLMTGMLLKSMSEHLSREDTEAQ